MFESIITFVLGIVCIILGISHMKGNISSLHSYHRNRVSEEDIIPFGRLVGIGTIIIGIGLIIFGSLSVIARYTQEEIYVLVGTGVMIVSIIVGLGFSFYGMIKYNKGIF